MPTKIFFCEPTDRGVFDLRVYESSRQNDPGAVPPCPLMPGDHSYHNAHSERLGEFSYAEEGEPDRDDPAEYEGDSRWPTHCACGYAFTPKARRQVWRQRLIRRTDTGELYEGYRSLPPGAVWNAHWLADHKAWTGPDGRSLICKLPNGRDWMIDSRASNCTVPGDDEHKCWVRHGRPEDGDLHVDKNGLTCAAGAGSIQAGDYHGFLHHGHLTD